METCKARLLLLFYCCLCYLTQHSEAWRPCPELSTALRLPCRWVNADRQTDGQTWAGQSWISGCRWREAAYYFNIHRRQIVSNFVKLFSAIIDNNYRCNVVPFAATGQLGAVAMDCDRVVFAGDAPQLPYGAPIVAYTQRFSGQQTLPAQVGDPSHLHNQLSWVKKVLCLISETIGGIPT